jgi:PST family polysaccharide transporter
VSQPKRDLSRLFTFTLTSSVLIAILGIVRGKVAALVLGAAGVGTTGFVMSFATTAVSPAQLVAGPGLAAAIARATRPSAQPTDVAAAQAAYDTAWTGTILIAILGVAAAAAAGPRSFPDFGSSAAMWIALGGLSLVATQAANVTGRTLASAGRGGVYTIASTIAMAIQATTLVAGTWIWGIEGWFLGNLVGAVLGIGVWQVAASRASLPLRITPRPALVRAHLVEAARLAAAGIAGQWAGQLAILAIRSAIQAGPGAEANGLFGACWAMDTAILMAVLQTVGNFVFPRYAAAATEADLRDEIESASRFVLRFAPPILLTAIAVRGPLLTALYTREFAPAIPLLGLILAGDVAKAVSWVQGGVLLYRGHAWSYAALQGVSFALLAGAGIAGVEGYGLIGLGWAYVATFTASVALTGLAMRTSAGVAPAASTIGLALGATALALASNAAAEAWWWGPVIPAVAAVAWAIGAGLPQAGFQMAKARFS